ncbi:lipopolysaccharide transport periplasmic protein LptA [Salinimonas sediminis]|uniref:Lipopolysaccharide export system protein LptA n=1 Tax=Salinimonas sediminis TaxID=2303538 RepID=A0A346NIW2_9ALTE|nr:lipopolysaccharide transport periplasmic protein LptA [Salinimonas sediminis]AXR05469.1 lipopolysaccharide transport periplasmic protein LptA [Salinimonas sediminis]
MYKPLFPLASSLLALLCFVAPVTAGSGDFQKPITVDARTQSMDGKNKVTRFKDNVTITQGTLTIEADEVEVSAKDGEGREVMIARGNPAKYSQTMDDGSKVTAQASELRYEVNKRTISMRGDARISQNSSMVRGDSITYDMVKEQLLATSSDNNDDSRVTTVFRPQSIKKLNDNKDDATAKDSADEQKNGEGDN